MRAAYRAVLRGNRLKWRDEELRVGTGPWPEIADIEIEEAISYEDRRYRRGFWRRLGFLWGVALGTGISTLLFMIFDGKRDAKVIIATVSISLGALLTLLYQLQWLWPIWPKHTSTPKGISPDRGIEVAVTILDNPNSRTSAPSRGAAMAAALEGLAAAGGPKSFGDATDWERETREERTLPGREP